MNTSPARTPFMDYETRKKIRGRKYVFQNQTKKNFTSNENPRSMQKTKLLSSFAWLQWNPAEFYFGPNLPNGPMNNKFTQCLQIDTKGMGFFVKWKSWQTVQRKSGSITSRKSS